jgi:hypothetical protein
MAVGNASSVGAAGLNSQLGSVAVGIRNWAQQCTALWTFVQSLGANETAQVAALTAMTGWEVSGTDPQTFWTTANYAWSVAQLYYGSIAQPSAFNFDSGLANARGAS